MPTTKETLPNCTILQLEQSSKAYVELADELYLPATTAVTSTSSPDQTLPTAISKTDDEKFPNQQTSITDIVINALDSISSLSYRGQQSMLSPSNSPKVKRSRRLSYLEKSQRLLQHCESWATLGFQMMRTGPYLNHKSQFTCQSFETAYKSSHCDIASFETAVQVPLIKF
jgi:hypothetical protein